MTGVRRKRIPLLWSFDKHFTIAARVVNLIQTANFELHCINSVYHFLSVQATRTLFFSFTTGLL